MKNAEAELNCINDTLNRRVEVRTAAVEERSRELQRSNQELEKYAFFDSHELRRPLRLIVTYAQRLEKHFTGLGAPDAEEWTARIVRNVTRFHLFGGGVQRNDKAFVEEGAGSVIGRIDAATGDLHERDFVKREDSIGLLRHGRRALASPG